MKKLPVVDVDDLIASASPGLKELLDYAKKSANWLEHCIERAEKMALDGRFDALAEASRIDAANYKTQLREARSAIAKATGE